MWVKLTILYTESSRQVQVKETTQDAIRHRSLGAIKRIYGLGSGEIEPALLKAGWEPIGSHYIYADRTLYVEYKKQV